MSARTAVREDDARAIYGDWRKPLVGSLRSRVDLSDYSIALDALAELDRAEAAGSDAAFAAWARKWARPALAKITGRNL